MSLLKTPKQYKKTTWGKRVKSGERSKLGVARRRLVNWLEGPKAGWMIVLAWACIILENVGNESLRPGYMACAMILVVGWVIYRAVMRIEHKIDNLHLEASVTIKRDDLP